MEGIEYKCVIYAGGTTMWCVESYETLHERLRAAHLKPDEEAQEMRWLEPLELTIRAGGVDGSDVPARPVRAMVSPAAISLVMEIPVDQRQSVDE